MVEFDRAPFGIVGLETAVPLVFDRLVHAGRIARRPRHRAAVGQPGAGPQPARRHARAKARRPTSPSSRPTCRSRSTPARSGRSRRTRRSTAGSCGGGRRDHRRRQSRVPECLRPPDERLPRDSSGRAAPAGAPEAAGARSADARRALRLRQRLSRARLPESASAVPAPVDDLAARAGSARRAARRAARADRSRRRPGDRRRAARAHAGGPARRPPRADASALQLRAVHATRDDGFALRELLRAPASPASGCCSPTTCGTPGRRSSGAPSWCRQAGGTVIATVEICDRMEAVADAGVPNYALAEYQAPENYRGRRVPDVPRRRADHDASEAAESAASGRAAYGQRSDAGCANASGCRTTALASRLERSTDYNREDSASDPVQIVRPFDDPADREIAGFCAAALAFGRVASVLNSIDTLFAIMGPSAGRVRARASIPRRRIPSCARWCIAGRAASTSSRCCGSCGRCWSGRARSSASSSTGFDGERDGRRRRARQLLARARWRSTCARAYGRVPRARRASATSFRGRPPAAPASG